LVEREEYRDSRDRLCLKITSPKYQQAFLISPDMQGFYGVAHEAGECGIKGVFTSLTVAERYVENYIRQAKMTQGAISAKRAVERKAYKEKYGSRVSA
jgi:hypothetical protein